jgi:hypothetical protein
VNTGEYKWYQEKTVSFGRKKRDDRKTQHIIEKNENLHQLNADLNQTVAAKMQ